MPPPSFWIGTSWKMHKTLAEARAFARTLAAADADRDPRIQRFVIPSFTAVREVSTALTLILYTLYAADDLPRLSLVARQIMTKNVAQEHHQ